MGTSCNVRERLLEIREYIFDVAKESGDIEKVLKWFFPSYLTLSTKTGTTLRLSKLGSEDTKCGLFVHYQSSLVAEY